MNCCNKNDNDNGTDKEQQGTKHKGFMSHMWMMILCCGAPIILLMLIPVISSISPSASGTLNKIIPFLCPIMMLLMLPMMLKGHKQNK